MRALSNTQSELSCESDSRQHLKKSLFDLQQANKDKEAQIWQLEQDILELEKNNQRLEQQLQAEEKEWESLRQKQHEEEKSEGEAEQEMDQWIQNVQKYNGLPQQAIDSLLTIEFDGGQHQMYFDQDDSCPACYGQLSQGSLCTYLPCAHLFHQACISNHLKVNRFCLACQQPVQV